MADELTTREAAKAIGVTRSRVQHLCQEGLLPWRKIGEELGPHRAIYLIPRAAVEAYRDSARKAGWTKGKPRGPRKRPSADA